MIAMEDLRQEQIEALQALTEYSPRLLKAMRTVTEELRGNRQPDTDEYLRSVVDGMNWEIEVLNGTMSLINETEEKIDKAAANDLFVKFSEVYLAKDDAGLAAMLEEQVVPFFENFEAVAKSFA